MKMVGHDAIGGDTHGDTFGCLADQAREGGEILVIVEDGRFGVSAIDDVIGDVGDGGACGARHAVTLAYPLSQLKYNDPFL